MNMQDVIATFGSMEKARERIEDICEHTDDEVEAIVGLALLGLDSLAAADPEREAKVDRAIIAFGDAVIEHDDACGRAADSDGDGADVQASIDSRRFMEHARDALRALLRPAPPSPSAVADKIVRDVAELPDRDSPEDWPEAMLVTGDELRAIVLAALAASNANARGGE